MSDSTQNGGSNDGIDRRGFLKCMAWAGTGVVWAMKGGILQSRAFGAAPDVAGAAFSFVQVSDSHVGFNKGAYTDVVGTFQATVARINALPRHHWSRVAQLRFQGRPLHRPGKRREHLQRQDRTGRPG
jgi:hypothetical protein